MRAYDKKDIRSCLIQTSQEFKKKKKFCSSVGDFLIFCAFVLEITPILLYEIHVTFFIYREIFCICIIKYIF